MYHGTGEEDDDDERYSVRYWTATPVGGVGSADSVGSKTRDRGGGI